MADVRGKSTKQNQLIGVIYDNAWVKNDNGKVIGGMVDFIRPDKDDPNPHLMTRVSDEMNPRTGKPYISNGLYYSVEQINAMYGAAQGNGYTEKTKNGGSKQVFGVKADIVPTKVGKNRGLAVDTRTLGPVDFQMTPEVLTQVYRDIAAVKEANKVREEQERAAKDAVARERQSPTLNAPGWEQPQSPTLNAPGWEQPQSPTAAERHGVSMDEPTEDQDYNYQGPDF